MNGRIYDPVIGRMMQSDPVVQAPTMVLSYNRYAYVWNNPMNRIDPTGYFSDTTSEDGHGDTDIGEAAAAAEADNDSNLGDDDGNIGLTDQQMQTLEAAVEQVADKHNVDRDSLMDIALDELSKAFEDLSGITDVKDFVNALEIGDYAAAAFALASIVPNPVTKFAKIVKVANRIVDRVKAFRRGGKTNFTVTPDGVAIPNDPSMLRKNLDTLEEQSVKPNVSRKFLAEDINGPVRIRVEKAHKPNPNYTGPKDPLHTVDHIHIDRRKNVTSGPWKSKEKVEYDWPF